MPTIEEYRHLRRMAQQRERRMEQAGIKTPGVSFPKPSEVKNLNREMRRLERWMNDPKNTVKGARAEQARIEQAKSFEEAERAARKEAARQRKNASERERYRERKAAEGKTVKPRQKLTEEERKEHRRESERKYRERVREETKQKVESLEALLNEMTNSSDRNIQKEGNWLSGMYDQLKAKGIKVTSLDELKKWKQYFDERNRDKDRKLYDFSNWIDEMAQKAGKSASKLKASDIDRVMNDFENWKKEDAALAAEFARERQPNEYTADQMGNLMDLFMNIL